MADRKIASIMWRQIDPRRIEVVFADGAVESIAGTHAQAAQMAGDAGMRPVSSPLGTIRWSSEGPTKDGRSPKRIGPWLST